MTTKPAAVFALLALLALSLAAQSACAPPTRPTAPATGVRAISPEVVLVAPHEALSAARMILHENNRSVYNLTDG